VEIAFLPPRQLPTLVRRERLERRLGPDTGASWTLVVGPPGAGKTTLVRGWLEGRREPWTWVGIDEAPYRRRGIVDLFVRGVQRARPERPLDALDAVDMDAGDDVAMLARLVDELAGEPAGTPITLIILDDAHLLHPEEWRVVGWLVNHLPPTLHPVIVGRSDPPIPLGRERASGHMAEVRGRDLAFGLADTEQLITATAGPTSAAVAQALQARTEGWAAGVRLAGLAIRDGVDPEQLLDRISGQGSSIAEFLLEEVLDRQTADRRAFLRAAAGLRTLDPEMCDAVTGRTDSDEVLRRLAADGLFVSRVEQGEGYRFHPLLAELLRYEQLREDPDAAREQHRRAAGWLVAHDRAIEAIEHLLAAGDQAEAHQLVVESFRPLYVGAHRGDLERWLTAVPDEVIASSVERAMDHCVALSLVAADDTLRWWAFCAERVEPDDRWVQSRLECVLALNHAVRAQVDDMRAHWEAGRRLRPFGRADPFDEIIASWSIRLATHLGDARAAVAEARELLAAPRQLLPDASALSVLAGALDAAEGHDVAVAVADLAVERWREAGEPDLPGMLDALVVEAAAARRAGDPDAADELVDTALSLPPPRRAPHFLTTIALLERARIEHARGGRGWPAELAALAEALRMGGAPSAVVEWVGRVRAQLEGQPEPDLRPTRPPEVGTPPAGRRPSGLVEELTERELVILGFLASHLSFPEVGAELHISRHTVKSHVTRIYRKLGASSRSEAVRTARQLGILPG
jgi:LuxR family transcriptional regulator, maltose regulon positive regulatory protein